MTDGHEALLAEVEAQRHELDELKTNLTIVMDMVERLEAGSPDDDGVIQDVPELDAWVNDWLAPTFSYTRELLGWAELAGARSHLAALHQAHRHAVGKTAHATDPVVWHTTHLPRAIAEIQALRDRTTNEQRSSRPHGPLRGVN